MRFVTACWISLISVSVIGLAPLAGEALVSDKLPNDSVDTSSYNVTFALKPTKSTGPADAVTLIVGSRPKGKPYLLRLSRDAVQITRYPSNTLVKLSESKATGLGAKSAAVTVKCRPCLLVVEFDRQVVARLHHEDNLSGGVGFLSSSSGFDVESFRIQEIGAIHLSDDFAPGAGQSEVWTPVEGSWRFGFTRDPLIARDNGPVAASWYEATPASDCLSVAGHPFWEDYSASVACEVSNGARTGLAFYYHDPRNYCLFQINSRSTSPGSATAELVSVINGKPARLQQKEITYRPSQWYRLRVDTQGDFARAMINGTEIVQTSVPGYTEGKVGLYANGKAKVKFDDVEIHSLQMIPDQPETLDLSRWSTRAGKWTRRNGKLCVDAKGETMSVLRSLPFGEFSCRLALQAANTESAGLVFGLQQNGDHYFVESVSKGKDWELGTVVKGKRSALSRIRTSVMTDGLHVLEVDRQPRGGLRWKVDDSSPQTLHDFSMGEGKFGLKAAGKGTVSFSDFSVLPVEVETTSQVFSADFSVAQVKGKGKDDWVTVVGHLMQPTSGSWMLSRKGDEQWLTGKGGSPGSLWYRFGSPGNTRVEFEVRRLPPGRTAGAVLGCESRKLESGYRVSVAGGDRPLVSLLRHGQVVASGSGIWGSEQWIPVKLFRDGGWVVAQLSGNAPVTFRDDQPLTGSQVGLWCQGEGVEFDNFALWNDASVRTDFNRVSTDWYASSGQWNLHSGMACIDWDYWVSGDGRDHEGLYWNRRKVPSDVEVDFCVSEYSEGEESGDHHHFPYYDIRLVLAGDGKNQDSGYSFILGKGQGRGVALLRDGNLLAENPDYPIAMRGHCNSPRSIHVVARKLAGHVELWCNEKKMLDYEDPNALGGGYAALGVKGCRANFNDFLATAMRPWKSPF